MEIEEFFKHNSPSIKDGLGL